MTLPLQSLPFGVVINCPAIWDPIEWPMLDSKAIHPDDWFLSHPVTFRYTPGFTNRELAGKFPPFFSWYETQERWGFSWAFAVSFREGRYQKCRGNFQVVTWKKNTAIFWEWENSLNHKVYPYSLYRCFVPPFGWYLKFLMKIGSFPQVTQNKYCGGPFLQVMIANQKLGFTTWKYLEKTPNILSQMVVTMH